MRLMHINLILTTDLLARGIDLPEVALVINFDLPLTSQEFTHRINRAGRFGGQGFALTLGESTCMDVGHLIQVEDIDQCILIDAVIGKRKEKEEMVIEHIKVEQEEFDNRETCYKRQKLQSGESKISEWQDPDH